MTIKRLSILAFFSAGMLIAPASAHKGATGIVKERMETMSDMKEAMATIGKMLKGSNPYDKKEALAAVGQLIRHGGRIRDQFPDTDESRQKASEATALVWTQRVRFDGFAEEFVEAAGKLEAAISGDEADGAEAAFFTVGKACSACHEDFRVKKH